MSNKNSMPFPSNFVFLAGFALVVASNFVFGMDKTKFEGAWGKLLIYYIAAGLPIWIYDNIYGTENKNAQYWAELILSPLVVVFAGMVVLQSILGRQI